MGIDGIFGLGDDILAGLDNDYPILVLQLRLFYLNGQLISDIGTYYLIISSSNVTPFLDTSNQDSQISF